MDTWHGLSERENGLIARIKPGAEFVRRGWRDRIWELIGSKVHIGRDWNSIIGIGGRKHLVDVWHNQGSSG